VTKNPRAILETVFLYTFSFILYVTHPLDPISGAQGIVDTPAHYKTVVVNGLEVKLKFFVTCNLLRPPFTVEYVSIV